MSCDLMSQELPQNCQVPEHPLPEFVISVRGLGKCYRIYSKPQDRLKQALWRGRKQYFQEFWALRDISLEVRRGETVGIMGRNGCGKSTLLQMICGTLTPTEGQIQIHGRVAALLELGAGFNPEFTGRDNIYTNGAILGLSREEIDARYEAIVAFSELEGFIDRPVKTYSSGMYVRLAFAVAISVDPDVLVVDEALSVGDEAFQRKCFSRLEEIQSRGGTILFVSHSAGAVIDLCDRAVLLDRGELLTVNTPNAVVNQYHRLLYAPVDHATRIREEIRRGEYSSDNAEAEEEAASQQPGASNSGETRDSAKEEIQEYFDPNLIPKSTIEYPENGASIFDPRITTLSGLQVNVLAPRQYYLISYRVRFAQPAFHVRLGTLIKNVLGTEISGAATDSEIAEHVPAGSEIHVALQFQCLLTCGTYFANVGLIGWVDGEQRFLHRLVDALAFRVAPERSHSTAGTVNLFVNAKILSSNSAFQDAA